MDLENIFRDVKLSKTEMTMLRSIQNDPEQCIRQGARAAARQCYNNPSSLVRLAKKLGFSGWLELVYFVKFNITMSEFDVTNGIDYMGIQPEGALVLPLASLKQQRILIHGNGFSQLITQYVYDRSLVTDIDTSLAPWPDHEIPEQKNAICFGSIWIISKSGRNSSTLNWVKALERKEINLVCSTGGYRGPLAWIADTAFIIHDPQKFDDDVYWSNPFLGYCILGFKQPLKMWSTSLRSNSQPPLNATQAGGIPGWRLVSYLGHRVMRQFCREAAYA